MTKNDSTSVRRNERYSHIYISLKVKAGSDWQLIKAADWNEDGFNFFSEHKFDEAEVFFKKGVNEFCGNIVWTRRSDDYGVIFEMILNTMLFEELEKLKDKKDVSGRIINLVRSQGRIEEKKKLLSALNRHISETETEALAKKHNEENALYRYGVKVESPEWSEIVKYALDASEVVRVMDRLNENLSGLTNDNK